MGEVTASEALRTIEGICKFYSVRDFVLEEDGRVAVYNGQNDNFHYFRWSTSINRYIYCGSVDYIPNWKDKQMGIF